MDPDIPDSILTLRVRTVPGIAALPTSVTAVTVPNIGNEIIMHAVLPEFRWMDHAEEVVVITTHTAIPTIQIADLNLQRARPIYICAVLKCHHDVLWSKVIWITYNLFFARILGTTARRKIISQRANWASLYQINFP